MKTLLQVKSSIFGDQGQSAQLGAVLIEKWKAAYPESEVVVRDLVADSIAHFDMSVISALMTEVADRTDEQSALVSLSDQLVNEIVSADALVISAPMYNFAVPSQLKAWVDMIARNGVTFKYTENGPVGLLEDKPVYILATRGGMYKEAGLDHQVPWLKQILSFMGLNQVQVIYAEGLNMAEKEASLAEAQEIIANISV